MKSSNFDTEQALCCMSILNDKEVSRLTSATEREVSRLTSATEREVSRLTSATEREESRLTSATEREVSRLTSATGMSSTICRPRKIHTVVKQQLIKPG